MFGRNLNEIKDYTNTDAESSTENNIIDLNNWNEHLLKIQSLIYPAIFDRTINKKNKMIQRLNKTRKLITENSFPINAVVMLRDPNRNDKFEPKYLGPYYIVRRTRNGNYVIRDATGEELERRVPPDQLKLISKTQRDVDIASNVYEIEKIIEHRGTPGNYEYHVKWKNYHETTWEPESNFHDVNIIRDYWKH